MRSINSPELSRNYGFWNESEQQALLNSTVAIAGVGGDGFQLGLKLAQMGVSRFSVADPEVFEPENTNRVPGATVSTYGHKKADVFAKCVLEINEEAQVTTYLEGVQGDNVKEFILGADLVLDESELTYMQIGTMIAREARRQSIPQLMVMNVGFAAHATSFNPKSRNTFERFMGIPENAPLDEIKDMKVDFSRCLPTLPKYGDIRTLLAVQAGSPLPSISGGVDVASALGTTQAFLHLTREVNNKRPSPVWAPNIAYMDAYDLSSGVAKYPRLRYAAQGIRMALRSKYNLNPEASFTQQDRDRRASEYKDS